MRVKVRLSKQARSVSDSLDSLHPIGKKRVEGKVAVQPNPSLMRIEPGCEAKPSRYAFGRIAKRVVKKKSFAREPVQRRGPRPAVHDPQRVRAELIGQDKENVWLC